ncbi:HAD hydrolase family protein, partial [Listeria monocytogenes]|uniref:HAD hydrolase family protein n=1 Tax=Listeria monocytogenes TaxID=1639 RepID=UPI000B156755
DLAAFLDYHLSQILTAGDPAYMQKNYQEMMAPIKDTLNCVFTADLYFEFTAQGIDKAKALDTVLTPMGIHAENVIAVSFTLRTRPTIYTEDLLWAALLLMLQFLL